MIASTNEIQVIFVENLANSGDFVKKKEKKNQANLLH